MSSDDITIDQSEIYLKTGQFEKLIGSRILKNYVIESIIGSGGMSHVFLITQEYLQKKYALKILLPHLINNEISLHRFFLEAKTLTQLDHPNIIKIQDFGMLCDSIPYLIMDYVDGMPLSKFITTKGRLSQNEAVSIFSQICSAMEHAHSKKIIHRDLKPSNIMILGDGNIKILDFGIAKMLDESDSFGKVTKTGEVFGSPYYMSPEQCRGESLDEKSDIYSMGCLMYEAITGNPPFVGSNILEAMHMQLNDRPQSLKLVLPKNAVSASLEIIILTCLEKEPDKRFKSFKQIQIELADIKSQNIDFMKNLYNDLKLWFINLNYVNRQLLLLRLSGVILSLIITAYVLNDFFIYNNTCRIVSTLPQLNFLLPSNQAINSTNLNISVIDNQIKFFQNKLVDLKSLSNNDIFQIKEDIAICQKNYLITRNIDLEQLLIANLIMKNSQSLSSLDQVDISLEFLKLSQLVGSNSLNDFEIPIKNVSSLKNLVSFLKNSKFKKIIDLSLRELNISLLPQIITNTTLFNLDSINEIISKDLLLIADSYFASGINYQAQKYYLMDFQFLKNKTNANKIDIAKALSQYGCIQNNYKSNNLDSNASDKANSFLDYSNKILAKVLSQSTDGSINQYLNYDMAINFYRLGKLHKNDDLKCSFYNSSMAKLKSLKNSITDSYLKKIVNNSIIQVMVAKSQQEFRNGQFLDAISDCNWVCQNKDLLD